MNIRAKIGALLAGLLLVVGLASCDAATQNATPTAASTPQAGKNGPADVVSSFLLSLQADPSGAASTQYLGGTLRDDAKNGKSVASMLGVQTIYKSFKIGDVDGGNIDGNADVRVSLSYDTGPTERLFRVLPENSQWKIVSITP